MYTNIYNIVLIYMYTNKSLYILYIYIRRERGSVSLEILVHLYIPSFIPFFFPCFVLLSYINITALRLYYSQLLIGLSPHRTFYPMESSRT